MSLIRLVFIPVLSSLLLSCSQGGALTPVQCFEKVKFAVLQKNSDLIEKNLSHRSFLKIKRFHDMIGHMDDGQVKYLADIYGYDEKKMRNMKISDYLSLYFFVKKGFVLSADSFKNEIVASDINGSQAVLRTSAGLELNFIREWPYWKLDISDL